MTGPFPRAYYPDSMAHTNKLITQKLKLTYLTVGMKKCIIKNMDQLSYNMLASL